MKPIKRFPLSAKLGTSASDTMGRTAWGNRGLEIVDQPPDASKRMPPFYWAAFELSGDWR